MAWSASPFQRTRLCRVWSRSSSAGGQHRGSRRYDVRPPLWVRRLCCLWSGGQKKRGNSGFDRFVFQDAIQSERSHSSGKAGCLPLGTHCFLLPHASENQPCSAKSMKAKWSRSQTEQYVLLGLTTSYKPKGTITWISICVIYGSARIASFKQRKQFLSRPAARVFVICVSLWPLSCLSLKKYWY